MSENEISGIIIDACYHSYVDLGPGLLESVYEEILCYELRAKGLYVEGQKSLPVLWKDVKLELGYRTKSNCGN